jgi:hypothetical protein
MPQRNSNKVLREWVTRINDEGRGLTHWEEHEFMPSVTERVEVGLPISERQEEILENIYAEKTK